MKKQVLVIHGGNCFEKYDDYLDYLRNKDLTLEKLNFVGWKETLAERLGEDYTILSPQMPNSRNARYVEWKIWFEKIIPLLGEPVILVGHSLGGTFLSKYLSENVFPKTILATLLVAPAFNNVKGNDFVDFVIPNDLSQFDSQGGQIYLLQSKDDEVVPFSNLNEFSSRLPSSTPKVFENYGHFHMPEFPEIVDLIRSL